MSAARLKHFGWGREGEGLTAEEEAFVIARAQARFGTALKESASAPRLEDIKLEAPSVTAPASLTFCTSAHYDRVAHTYGKSYPELARGLARDYASAPDVVDGMARVPKSMAPPTVCGPYAIAPGPLMTRTCVMRLISGKK